MPSRLCTRNTPYRTVFVGAKTRESSGIILDRKCMFCRSHDCGPERGRLTDFLPAGRMFIRARALTGWPPTQMDGWAGARSLKNGAN